MDKIYSRKRIKIPNYKNFIHDKKIKKVYYLIIIWLVLIVTFFVAINFISAPFEKLCVAEAKRIGTVILNDVSTQVLKDVNYDDIIIISKDTNEKITMVKSNVILINILASDITYKIQERLSALEKEDIPISLGVLTGIRLFYATGPNINIKVKPIGTVETSFRSELESSRNKPDVT